MARDKFYEGYMTGKCSALDLVQVEGIEGLKRDITMRKAYPVPIDMSRYQWDKFISTVGQGSKNTIFALVYVVLHEDFGFGLSRMDKFYEGFERRFLDVLDISCFGNRYVSLVDYGVYMKEKYPDLRLDIDRIAVEEDAYMEKAKIETPVVDTVITTLKNAGYTDAAEYLEKRKYSKE